MMKNLGVIRRWLQDVTEPLYPTNITDLPQHPSLHSPSEAASYKMPPTTQYIPDESRQQPLLTPKLPLELERHIFELAARSHKRFALRLILVARRVHIWIEPILYSVLLFNVRDPQRSIRKVLQYKSTAFLSQHVRSLGLTSVDTDGAFRLVVACSGVVNFACWLPTEADASSTTLLGSAIRCLHVERLALPLHNVFGSPDFRQSFFLNITHLHIFDIPPLWSTWTGFDLLPCLTHLAFNRWSHHPESIAALHRILSTCKLLRYLILVILGSWYPNPLAFDEQIIEDPRVAFVPVFLPMKDWEDCANGALDHMWSNAENICAKKGTKQFYYDSEDIKDGW